jgi:RNA-directed DNA polymerase
MTTTPNLARPWGLLEPDAWKSGMSGSEGAGAQQCAPATRRFRIQWKRRRGSDKWYVYTFIADRPFRAVKAKIRALTHRVSQANMGTVITRINQILRGWTNYFRHAVCKHTFSRLRHFVNWRLIRWLRKRHRWQWGQFRRRFTTASGRWLPFAADGVEVFNPGSVTVTRYRYRGSTIPNPYLRTNHA